MEKVILELIYAKYSDETINKILSKKSDILDSDSSSDSDSSQRSKKVELF